MTNDPILDSANATMLALPSQGAHMQHALEDEAAAEVDEPPDNRHLHPGNQFKRSAVRKISDHSESLLTKALHSEEEIINIDFDLSSRRRSMNSSVSLASTADLTSDTGFTSPARTNTPSPPPPVVSLARLNADFFYDAKSKLAPVYGLQQTSAVTKPRGPIGNNGEKRDPTVEALTKKRCISFACGPKADAKKPLAPQRPVEPKPAADEKPQRKSCIKFACPAKPVQRTPLKQGALQLAITPNTELPKEKDGSPVTVRKLRSSSIGRGRSQRSLTPRPMSRSPMPVCPAKYLTANPTDLNCESSRFHEFASDEPQEEDWIRINHAPPGRRLTIDDTLKKENEIRRLGKEAEEEELEEEELEEEEDLNEGDEDEDDDDDEDRPDDNLERDDVDDVLDIDDGYEVDNQSASESDGDDFSDGYKTDNEIGFAESDDDDDGGNLDLWTPSRGPAVRLSGGTTIYRRPSMTGNRSDSSSSDFPNPPTRVARTKRLKIRARTPELPDSTDFVCGTLDEDRPLEEAYLSCLAARRQEKLHPIPQDIDPSFPTSEPEDEDIELNIPVHDSDDNLSDVNANGRERRKRIDHTSPKRYHSPPPRRHHSPPKARGRSPKRLFDLSPRHLLSPPLGPLMQSPPSSLVFNANRGNQEIKSLAFRPGLTQTKSLPRAPAMFPQHLKAHRRSTRSSNSSTNAHVRGAIDIVKGLEQKRQRRKEKFKEKYQQMHCNKARKGQIVEKKPQPGQGAERMREIGLLMAGKLGPDQFVLSI
ncbi:uncharacterized protein GGS22DRAFT_30281 [Annulohypoxylon maeteangense]|uniref:uncharacterized protein n=1 Tax=Annulohypoxylon maeteangense TaxID=1927788 RepID=UPI0020088BC6|nr:uncharacterized protein GGS22DRAFT_30281 [Annulohypoxylon maeteangense]KAI0883410.1 hypothetical protein GGS22DRAFT_30281 [Annulohypoxylon maeteangense]